MKLIITEVELTAIVRAHVLATVQMRDGSNIAIDFSATRGADGITATIDIPYMGVGSLDLGMQQQPEQVGNVIAKPATKPKSAAPIQVAKQTVTGGIFGNAAAGPEPEPAGTPVASDEQDSDTSTAATEGFPAEPAEAPTPKSTGASLFP